MILVVDDTPCFREPISAALARDGHDVLVAADGAAGLALARSARPDLILLDMAMPVMDGLTVLERLRDDPATARMPVILLTAMSDRDRIVRAVELGVTGYLIKSRFTIKQLLAQVAAQMAASRAA